MQAAAALGGDPSRIGTRSLRFGGASALWAAYRDSAVVKRWRRWASEAFQGYLWEARGNATEVAAPMAGADLTHIRGYTWGLPITRLTAPLLPCVHPQPKGLLGCRFHRYRAFTTRSAQVASPPRKTLR